MLISTDIADNITIHAATDTTTDTITDTTTTILSLLLFYTVLQYARDSIEHTFDVENIIDR